jgi:tetratricopeptide (TPR) repeat protein
MSPQPEPARANGKFAEAMAALGQADFATAIERLDEAVRDDPEHAEAWMYLGVCYLETGQGQRALESLERAARVAGSGGSAAQIHYLLGVAHGASGALDRALESFHHALALDPAHQKAEEFRVRTEGLIESRQHYKAALMLLREKSQPNYAAIALRELLLSITGFPNSPARDELGFCFREVQKSLRETFYEVDPTYAFPPFFEACERGYQAVRLLNWPAARQAYEEAVTMRDEPFVLHGLALAYMGAGDTESALRFWKQLLEREPEFDLGALGRVRAPGRVN